MSGFAPTPSQRRAITDRGGELLVSAAAGSGKTRVLTERLLERVCDEKAPESIDRFLVMTFSEAAAAELRSRIGDALSERARLSPDAKRLRRQAALLPRAGISTIHAFCSRLIREHCHELGLPPDFAIADEERARELQKTALDRTLDERYAAGDRDFLALADTVGAGRDDARLCELVLEFNEKLRSHARPEKWAAEQVKRFSDLPSDAGETVWGRELLTSAKDTALYWAQVFERLIALCSETEKLKRYVDCLSVTRSGFIALSLAADLGWEKTRAAVKELEFPRLPTVRKMDDAEAEAAEYMKSRRESAKGAVKKLKESFDAPSEKLLRELSACESSMRALVSLTLDFDRRYSEEKRSRSLMDYSDLELFAARLLTDENGYPTPAAAEVSARYAEVMVDEYQDVSRLQETIIRAVSDGGRKLFMVGDVKQSIYRFRLADPTLFIEKYNSFPDAEIAPDGAPRRVLLRENFRSRPEVVSAVNSVFGTLMSPGLGELQYDEGARLVAGREFAGSVPAPTLTVLDTPSSDDEDEDGDGEAPDKKTREARYTARKIRALVEAGTPVSEGDGTRPLRYGDVAVLLRTPGSSGAVYRRELLLAGVPVRSEQGGSFFDQPEISVMLSMLAVIDNPRQDVPLISVLRSELFGFTPDELALIRSSKRGGGCFYDALRERSESDKKCRDFLDTLSYLRSFSREATAGEVVGEVYSRLDCRALCRAMPDGERRRRNLDALRELGRQYSKTGWHGLRRFLLWLRSMRENNREPNVGSGGEGGGVSIMSIHSSKGLEFPVVFLCDTAHRFNKQDALPKVLVHPELGLGPKYIDTRRGVEYPTLARSAIKHRMERESLSEELRLLYVAMTRAKDRLYISCCLDNARRQLERLGTIAEAPMPASPLLTMQCPASWLITAALACGDGSIRLEYVPASAQTEAAADAVVSDASETADAPVPPLELDWRYPFENATVLPSKLTATEIKSLAEPDGEAAQLLPRAGRIFRTPRLDSKRPRNAAERGTATHLVLRYLDFSAAKERGVRAEIARLVAEGRISPEDAAAVSVAGIERLLSSPLGEEILSADEIMRELPFTLLTDAGELFPGADGEELLLQGVIDLCVRRGDTLTVADYKTDRLTAGEAPARAESYRSQVEVYARAIERMTRLPVSKKVVFFLTCGVGVEL